jgi:3-oxoacyl-[acyl-carrier protein] reductase
VNKSALVASSTPAQIHLRIRTVGASRLNPGATFMPASPAEEFHTTRFRRCDRRLNARATWLLIREYGRRLRGNHGTGRIISLTSDHTVGNLPYGASKGALERITLAAARELAHLGVTANVINPGPVDTGWMSDDIRAAGTSQTPLGRLGVPQDTGHLVDFLCSPQGGWINGQLLMSNGGFA